MWLCLVDVYFIGCFKYSSNSFSSAPLTFMSYPQWYFVGLNWTWDYFFHFSVLTFDFSSMFYFYYFFYLMRHLLIGIRLRVGLSVRVYFVLYIVPLAGLDFSSNIWLYLSKPVYLILDNIECSFRFCKLLAKSGLFQCHYAK